MEDQQKKSITGAEVLPGLAETYGQLYLTPDEAGRAAYRDVVLCGLDAPQKSLGHFLGDGRDSCLPEETPAGEVLVVTLHERQDFETFLRVMAYRCEQKPIPKSQGAAILDGVVNWTRIRAHKADFLRRGGTEDGWSEEFQRFTAEKRNYKDALIVLSDGPYSAISARAVGMDEDAWLSASHAIRKAHECTHFICRRLFPEKIDALWDEIVADAVGLYAAFGRYDPALAALFLGVGPEGYTGGRLENYVSAEEEDRKKALDRSAKKVYAVIEKLAEIVKGCGVTEPYSLAIRLEEEIECWKES